MSASPLTPLDYIAEGYWQDFLAGRPIAGGIAYETELHNCALDESLESLQRIDTLLSQVRRNMMKGGIWDEATLLVDEHYRNFMVFLAFYAGRVLAQQWQNKPHWYGQFELRKRYPELSLITDDFYQHMAVGYGDNNAATDALPLFFPLEPIGLRLFGNIDRPFKALQGGQAASGLYQAVSARLPDLSDQANNTDTLSYLKTESATHNTTQSIHSTTDSSTTISTSQPASHYEASEDVPVNNELADVNIVSANIERPSAATTVSKPLMSTAPRQPELQAKPELTKVASPATKPMAPVKTPPTPEMFTQLLIELDEIEVPQTAGVTEYQQACKVLDQFEQHIAKQDKPRGQVVFSDNHIAAKNKALLALQAAAEAGNTAAMLRLAMYELLGEGLTADDKDAKKSGVEWVKQAASKNDSRAQRLLSKLYYQGVGMPQDIDSGKYWLEQAADNGHIEAANLVSQWEQAQALITTQKQEQHSIKRYQLLFGAVIVVAVLILIIV
ncbi:sel1 repeat family protein [uncultured Psychrobacter sp.]|uniref:tetratricopeptide repeat protein n=1 Tax=uncultured Psychrobacter sp. TaxID=259303 RepID=UPI002595177B|nr:sel1 repeat family protein [uncultured Psychrobacter sp.]